MIHFASAKINIGLRVLNKRIDGYHNIDSVFYPIPLYDVLEIGQSSKFQYKNTGLIVKGDIHDNLIYKAWEKLNAIYKIPPISVHLHKAIPMGAGLGGGSSDATCVLKMMNSLFALKVSEAKLLRLANELGADCPFFIREIPMHVEGTGEILSPIDIDLSAYYIVIVKPNLHIDTTNAFSKVKIEGESAFLDLSVINDVSKWSKEFSNSFEFHLFNEYPILSSIKESLYASGALYASMSGSGSAIYGIFQEEPKLANDWSDHFVWQSSLS